MKKLLLLACLLCTAATASSDLVETGGMCKRGNVKINDCADNGGCIIYALSGKQNEIIANITEDEYNIVIKHKATVMNNIRKVINDIQEETRAIKEQFGIPQSSNMEYEALRQYKACNEISHAQVLVEHTWNTNDVKKAYKALKYYIDVFKDQKDMLQEPDFLYVAMRILKDGIVSKVDDNVLQALCNADVGVRTHSNNSDNWRSIYNWLVLNAEETLGEYHA